MYLKLNLINKKEKEIFYLNNLIKKSYNKFFIIQNNLNFSLKKREKVLLHCVIFFTGF